MTRCRLARSLPQQSCFPLFLCTVHVSSLSVPREGSQHRERDIDAFAAADAGNIADHCCFAGVVFLLSSQANDISPESAASCAAKGMYSRAGKAV